MDLEVAGADRHLYPVAVAPGVRERLRDRGLARSVETQHAAGRYVVRRRVGRRTGSLSSARGHSRWSSPGGPGSTTTTHGPSSTTSPGAVPARPSDDRTFRDRGLLADALREVRVRALEPLGDAAREGLDLGRELLVDDEWPTGHLGHELHRPVVVRRDRAHRRRGRRRRPRCSRARRRLELLPGRRPRS